jgi:hypothetical protein
VLRLARVGAFALLFVATGCGGGDGSEEGGNPRPRDDAVWDDLEEKAQRNGTVPLLVTLDVETRPEGYLSPGERAAQRTRIVEARKTLFADLQETGYENARGFDVIPVVALDATPRTMEALRRSPLVAGIEEDVAAGVSPSPSS